MGLKATYAPDQECRAMGFMIGKSGVPGIADADQILVAAGLVFGHDPGGRASDLQNLVATVRGENGNGGMGHECTYWNDNIASLAFLKRSGKGLAIQFTALLGVTPGRPSVFLGDIELKRNERNGCPAGVS
jgi:hypothetical protein